MSAAGPTGGLAGWVVDVVDSLGGPGIGLLVALENLFPPIPSEIVLPLAGFAAYRGSLTVVEAILWATAGSVVGALALYAIGAAVGTERLAWLAQRIPLMKADDVHRADAWFDRRGVWAVLFGRLIPGVRSLISIPAGVARMPLVTFTLFTTIGSLVWNCALILAGYALGSQWPRVENYVGPLGTVVVVVLVAVVALFVLRRFLGWRAARAGRTTRPEQI